MNKTLLKQWWRDNWAYIIVILFDLVMFTWSLCESDHFDRLSVITWAMVGVLMGFLAAQATLTWTWQNTAYKAINQWGSFDTEDEHITVPVPGEFNEGTKRMSRIMYEGFRQGSRYAWKPWDALTARQQERFYEVTYAHDMIALTLASRCNQPEEGNNGHE